MDNFTYSSVLVLRLMFPKKNVFDYFRPLLRICEIHISSSIRHSDSVNDASVLSLSQHWEAEVF